jgi:hypothetical protein
MQKNSRVAIVKKNMVVMSKKSPFDINSVVFHLAILITEDITTIFFLTIATRHFRFQLFLLNKRNALEKSTVY